jgi:amino acid adenylation domain-containing protein/non-ribosomal peptide synthase protein (TIGR01720 family)
MLAVLKAGGAFLPLDPEQPRQRLAERLAEAGASLVLHRGHALAQARSGWLNPAGLDLSAEPATPPDVAIHPEQLAYLILTSGSTGQPKAVAVAHGALTRHCSAIGERYAMQCDDVALHFAAFTFDAAMEQWLVPLINGCRLLVREETWSADQAYDALIRHGVTWFEMPPAYLIEIARWAEPLGLRLPLRACSVGGEAVPKEGLAQIRRLVGDAPILNGYGPTETLITPLVWTALPESPCDTAYAPIGTGVGERTLCVLDKDLNPLPLGAVGELYIGGPCLARGYLNRPDLTAERFIPDPFAADGGRLYRTGDRVRFRANGNVDYFGRNDHQIKLRGFRIELGEIEAAVLSFPAIVETVAVADSEGSNKRLIVYAVTDGSIEAEDIKSYLQSRLPDYMVPAQILLLDKLPRLSSGKVDRRTLPKPAAQARRHFRMPRTEAERQLAAIWQEVLGIEQVGCDDNFFELGGDSILSIRVVSRARQAGWRFGPRDMFLNQTVALLASAAQAHAPIPSDYAAPSGEAALTPIQTLFFQDAVPNRRHWNLSLLLKTTEVLSSDRIERALQRLHGHHHSLRLRYRLENGAWRQYYAEAESAEPGEPRQIPAAMFERQPAADAAEIAAIAQRVQRSLDLEHGPLFKAALIDVADGSQRLLLIAHHLIVDAVSWRILLEDLRNLYFGNAALSPSTASFQHWGRCLQGYAKSEALLEQIPYWQRQLADEACVLPRDFPCEAGIFAEAQCLSLRFSASITRQLLQQAPAAYRTRVNDLLLTALARVLCRWSGRNRVAIELESHGREDLFADTDLSRSVGWFTSLYPVSLPAVSDPAAAIKNVKESLRGVPDGGLGFGVLTQMAADEHRRALTSLPQPKVCFNYFGQLDEPQSLFAAAEESAGDDRDPGAPLPAWLEINAQVLDGELELRWRYSKNQYRTATVQALLNDYREELNALIGHCLSGVQGATPSDFPLAGLTQPQLDALPLAFNNVEDIYPLAPMQQGILFHALLEPETGVYVNQMTLDIDGLDVERFAAAWRRAIASHDILRSAFIARGEIDRPLQVVYKQVPLPLEILDWRDRAAGDAEFKALCAEEHQRGFNPAQAPLLRLLLVRVSEQRYRWIWTSHHILLDGWSTSQLLGEVLEGYAQKSARTSTGRYRDYIAWLQGKSASIDENFWRGYLKKLKEPTRLESVMEPSSEKGQLHLRLHLDESATRRLRHFASSQRVTLNTLIQGAWGLLLRRYCRQTAVAFGATMSGRSPELPAMEHILGLFINTLPIIVAPSAHHSVSKYLQDLQNDNLALREHEHTPLYDIQRWANYGGVALFDSLLVFENFPIDAALQNTETGLQFGVPVHIDDPHYPLTLAINIKSALEIDFIYALSAFRTEDIERMSRCLQNLLFRMAENPGQSLGHFDFVAPVDRIGHRPYNRSPFLAVHEAISRQARLQPQATALLDATESVCYGDLLTRSDRISRYLLSGGVGAGDVVGLCLPRSAEMVVAALGVLKCGAAFLPLDPEYPPDRLSLLLEDAGAVLALTRRPLKERLPRAATICLDETDFGAGPATSLQIDVHPQQTAYLIYTSGSTGRPKAVAVSHEALAMHCEALGRYYNLQADDCVLQFASFSFDAAIEQWLLPLLYGAEVVIRGDELWTPAETLAAIRRHAVTRIDLPPAYLTELSGQAGQGPVLSTLRSCTVGGEALARENLAAIKNSLGSCPLFNAYGPTETVITPLIWKAGPDCRSIYAPIGEPLGDRTAYVLDLELNPLPIGVAGELYIGGTGLAQGYHHAPALTAERFLPDPFSAEPGSRLYRTGDLVRQCSDGIVEFLSRADHQIKIRGYRVEPGEIEAQLLALPCVTEAVVVLRDGPVGPQLLAYIVSREATPDIPALRDALAGRLPYYMLPVHVMALPQLPRLASGKVDRRALPEPERGTRQPSTLTTGSARQLAEIWKELLGVDRIGYDDNFFELGGHSILAMRLSTKIKQRMDVELPVRQIFETPNFSAMAEAIEALKQDDIAAADLQLELSAALSELKTLSADELQRLIGNEQAD